MKNNLHFLKKVSCFSPRRLSWVETCHCSIMSVCLYKQSAALKLGFDDFIARLRAFCLLFQLK